MIRQSTIELLKEMRFGGMASELESQQKDMEAYREMPFDDRFAMLVEAEWNRRQANKYTRCVHNAHFAIPGATVERIEYFEDRKLSRKQMIQFSTCKYIEEGHHIIFCGASGNGKTYLACALGEAACRKLYSVRYIRMPELLEELMIAREHNELKKTMKAYEKVDLLILDEWLIRCLVPEETYAMLELIETRTRHGATIFCTQFETEGWYSRIDPDPESGSPICEAIMDRVTHNAYNILVDGEKSMRERYGLKAEELE
ncbi:MAG: ATP-binding protein [Clostridia bacterium]|nr:ATP-binding protein [Clostridia bacterium]